MEHKSSSTSAQAEKRDVYQIITEQIIGLLEKGTVPWKQPWQEAGIPKNVVSQRPYRGINIWLLALHGYEKNYFLTLNQVNQLGASLKKDARAHIVVYWNYLDEEKSKETGNGNLNGKRTPLLRYYKVYNVAQCENIPGNLLGPVMREAYPIPACEKVIKGVPQCPPIRHKENRAFYNALSDIINMPKKENFKSDESYYATLFHELAHSTGHYSRLNRSTLIQMSEFGSEPYSHEELIAEMGASFLESLTGIFQSEAEQNAAYIQGWISKLKNDKRFILSASSHAQKATDFILNVKFEEKEAGEEKEEM